MHDRLNRKENNACEFTTAYTMQINSKTKQNSKMDQLITRTCYKYNTLEERPLVFQFLQVGGYPQY